MVILADKLNKYKQKRDFDKTAEPAGGAGESGGQLHFVIQRHWATREHFDLRLEWDGTLKSWAVPKGPSYNTADKRLAVEVEDHPLEYRDFEGNIPKGEYGGGIVMLWDEGYWEPYNDPERGLREGSLKFIVHGERMKGKWALVRMKTKDEDRNWLLIKEKDSHSKSTNGISRYNTSVRTGRTAGEIEKNRESGNSQKKTKNPFERASVQLARLVSAVPRDEGWLFEMKYDGYRILTYIESGGARLFSRNGNDYSEKFRGVTDSLEKWARGRAMVLDGEAAVTDDEGKTDFQALQNYIKNPAGKNLCYIVFDILALDGEDLRQRPLAERKNILEELLSDAPKNIRYSNHVEGQGRECFAAAQEGGFEGIIGKRADSPYSGSRSGDWIKLKCDNRQEFVICGYTRTEKKSQGLSAIILGVYGDEGLIYAGRAGTGFTEKTGKETEAALKKLIRKTPPFKNPPQKQRGEEIFWVRPLLAAEIKFAEWTKENLLRQASFKGLRGDKDVSEIKREREQPPSKNTRVATDQKSVAGVVISSPGKLLYNTPAVTKLDIAEYYYKISGRMMPYIKNRVLSIVSCPSGVSSGSCFFKKHPGDSRRGIKKIKVDSKSGEDYFYITEPEGLINEVQMNTLEFHIWGSSADTLERPDMMVFDLDPDEGMYVKRIRQGVRDLKSILDSLPLKSFLKTSGGKGYHVVVPLEPSAGWDEFREFAKTVAGAMEERWPDRYTVNVRKEKRRGKIFIDWIRNGRGATSIAPYSVRAREGARVSMPIGWDELGKVAPDGITMEKALKRLNQSDPWADFFETKQRLE